MAETESTKSSSPDTSPSSSDSSTGSSYARGENQKPVSKAYRDNWSAIFGKKAKKPAR